MSVFDFLKKKERSESEPYYGDLEKTKILRALFAVPPSDRDEAWRNTLVANVGDASFRCGDPQVIEGPDGFPYFQLLLPTPGEPFQCYVVRHMIKDFLLEKGFGVVINASKPQPDWVFTYGDIANFHIRNEFYSSGDEWHNRRSSEVIQQEEKVLVGVPSEHVLPNEVRACIRDFLSTLGITDAKVCLMNRPRPEGHLQELVLNLTPGRFEKREHYEAVITSIRWFLPRQYAIICMEEQALANNFELI